MEREWSPTVLVLGPGGMKGILELGALLKLEKSGILANVNTYVGCSVGSIISLLLVCGYKVEEILKEAIVISIFDLMSIDISNMVNSMGILGTDKIKDKLSSMVKAKCGYVPTLEKLWLQTGKILTVTTYNVSCSNVEVINRDNNPDLSCIHAVMLSCNIPIICQQLQFHGCLYADGAIGNPYPVDVYDNGKRDILGIYITSLGANNKAGYLWRIAQSSINEITKRIIKSCSDRCKHIVLESPTIDTSGLTFTKETKATLIVSGWDKASEFVRGLGIDVPTVRPSKLACFVDDGGNTIYDELPDGSNVEAEPLIKDGYIVLEVTPSIQEMLDNGKGKYFSPDSENIDAID